ASVLLVAVTLTDALLSAPSALGSSPGCQADGCGFWSEGYAASMRLPLQRLRWLRWRSWVMCQFQYASRSPLAREARSHKMAWAPRVLHLAPVMPVRPPIRWWQAALMTPVAIGLPSARGRG